MTVNVTLAFDGHVTADAVVNFADLYSTTDRTAFPGASDSKGMVYSSGGPSTLHLK